MKPAQVTPGRVPPAPGKRRQITEHIITSDPNRMGPQGAKLIFATYRKTEIYSDPFTAPTFIAVRPVGKGWQGDVVLQGVGYGEVDALQSLLDSMIELGQGGRGELKSAHEVLHELRDAPASTTPWEQRPMGLRGPKPRAPRHDLVDAVTGKRVLLYKDTLKAHRDPNCTCAHCAAVTTPPKDTTT